MGNNLWGEIGGVYEENSEVRLRSRDRLGGIRGGLLVGVRRRAVFWRRSLVDLNFGAGLGVDCTIGGQCVGFRVDFCVLSGKF